MSITSNLQSSGVLPGGLLNRLQTQLDCLTFLLDEQLVESGPAGKWSVNEIVAHLARYHQIFLDRLERILGEECPSFPRYQAENDMEWGSWRVLARTEAISRLLALRARLTSTMHQLTPLQLSRSGEHSRFGVMKIHEWLEFFLLHEAHHLYVIFNRLQRGARRPL